MTRFPLTAAFAAALCLLPACASTSSNDTMGAAGSDVAMAEKAKTDAIEIMAPEPAAPDMDMVKAEEMAAPAPASSTPDLSEESVFYNAMTQWELQDFVQAVRDAGLEGALDGDQAVTVFAPDSAALARAGSGITADILKAHVVAGSYSAADIEAGVAEGGFSLTSLAGTPLKFYNMSGKLRIAGESGVLASFVGEPVSAGNGELYIVNSVIAQ